MVLVDLSADDCPPRAPQRWLNEPRRPSACAASAGLLAGGGRVCIGAFMGQLDASIVTVALPTLQRTLPRVPRCGHLGWSGVT